MSLRLRFVTVVKRLVRPLQVEVMQSARDLKRLTKVRDEIIRHASLT